MSTFATALHDFAKDPLLRAVLTMIALDFVLGVGAAVKMGAFRLAYVAQFARDDVLGKVFPWLGLYVAAKLAPSVSLLGIDLGAVQKAFFALVVAALAGSLANSLAQFGFPPLVGFPKALVGPEDSHVKPPPSPVTPGP